MAGICSCFHNPDGRRLPRAAVYYISRHVWCLETPRSDGVCFSFDLLTHDTGLFFRVAIILDILLTPCVLQVEYLNDAGAEKHREVEVLRVVVLRVWFFAFVCGFCFI